LLTILSLSLYTKGVVLGYRRFVSISPTYSKNNNLKSLKFSPGAMYLADHRPLFDVASHAFHAAAEFSIISCDVFGALEFFVGGPRAS